MTDALGKPIALESRYFIGGIARRANEDGTVTLALDAAGSASVTVPESALILADDAAGYDSRIETVEADAAAVLADVDYSGANVGDVWQINSSGDPEWAAPAAGGGGLTHPQALARSLGA